MGGALSKAGICHVFKGGALGEAGICHVFEGGALGEAGNCGAGGQTSLCRHATCPPAPLLVLFILCVSKKK